MHIVLMRNHYNHYQENQCSIVLKTHKQPCYTKPQVAKSIQFIN